MGKAKTPEEFEIDFAAEVDAPADAEVAAAARAERDADPAPAAPAPVAEEPVAKPARLAGIKANLPLIVAGIAVFTSLIATIGLLVASRNAAEAGMRIAALERALKEQAHAAPAAPEPAHHAATGLGPALDRNGDPTRAASAADVRRAFNEFRTDLVRYQGMGGNAAFVDGIRDGQAEIANRMSVILEKIDRVDRLLAGRSLPAQRPMPRHAAE